MAPATLVNVCGPGRSGTTMLDLMLGTPADAFSCGEAVAAFQPRRPEHEHLVCSCGEDPCPVWERLRAGPAEQFHRRVVDTLSVERVIDSSKWLGWVRDANRWGADSGMRVVNLLIWKEPLELAFSWWKRGELPADEEAIWCYVQYHARLLDAGFPVLSVPYADLADDPAGVLASTCRAIGLPYEPGQERFWTTQHHNLFGSSRARRTLRASDATIRRTEPSQEFLEASRTLAARVASDPELAGVLDRVQACAPA